MLGPTPLVLEPVRILRFATSAVFFSIEIGPLAALMIVKCGCQHSMTDARVAGQLLRLVREGPGRIPNKPLWLTDRRWRYVRPLLLRLHEDGGVGFSPVPGGCQSLAQSFQQIANAA